MQTKSSLIASGPETLIKKFAAVLDGWEIKNNTVKGVLPKYWNGNELVNTVEKLNVLLMEDTYFVVEEILFHKLQPI